MRLLIVILIILGILLFVYFRRKENFSIFTDNQRIESYNVSLQLRGILKKNSPQYYTQDADGNPIDNRIIRCEEHRTDFLKHGEQIGSGQTPKEWVDRNDKNCDFYREHPEECLGNKPYISSVYVRARKRSSGWFSWYKDSPIDTCYVKESENLNDEPGCLGGYRINPEVIYYPDGNKSIKLSNNSKNTLVRENNDTDFYIHDETEPTLNLQCYKVVDDLGYTKTNGECRDLNGNYPNSKSVTIDSANNDYALFSETCNNIHECQGFEINKDKSKIKYYGNSPYFTDDTGGNPISVIDSGDQPTSRTPTHKCYKKKNFKIGEDYKIFSGKCADNSGELQSNYILEPEVTTSSTTLSPDSSGSGSSIEGTTNSSTLAVTTVSDTSSTVVGESNSLVEGPEKSYNLINKCKEECDKIPECLGFTSNKDEIGQIINCNLYGERPDWVSADDWNNEYNVAKITPMILTQGLSPNILGRTQNSPDCYKKVNPQRGDTDFIITSGTCRGGVNLTSLPPITQMEKPLEECKTICKNHLACQGFSYNNNDIETCKLFGYMNDDPDFMANDPNNPDRLHIQIDRGNPSERDLLDENFKPNNFNYEKCYKKINYDYFPGFSVTNGSCNNDGVPTESDPVSNGDLKENCARECLNDISCQGYTYDKANNNCNLHGYMDSNPENEENIIEPGIETVDTNKKCYVKRGFKPILHNSIHLSNQTHSPKYGKCRGDDGVSFPGNYTRDNVSNVKECGDLCGNSSDTPIKCQGFDYTNNKCTFYGNDNSLYNNFDGIVAGSRVIEGNRDVEEGRNSVCYINNKYTSANRAIDNSS